MLFLPLIAFVFAPCITAAQDAPKPYSCGPCLLQPGTDEMTLVVDHAGPVAATLEWGISGEAMRTVEHSEAKRHHIFELTGLKPDRLYSYRIRTAGQLDSGARQFRTLPVAPESYRVITVGDVRSQPAIWGRVSGRIFEHESEALFMIGTGDYPSDGRKYPLWILQFFKPARDLLARMPLWPAIGNHEATRPAGSTQEENSKYFSLFELPGNEHWYRVDYHLMTLLIIDSNSHCDPSSEQYQWLHRELRSQRARYTLVAFHHAPFTSGPHGKVHLDGTPREWPLDEAQRFLVPLFEMYGVDLVLNGHDHLYERSEKDGLTYIVTGGGGAPLYKVNSTANRYQRLAQSKHHYVALDIDAEKIAVSAIDLDGEVFDQVAIPASVQSLQRRHGFIARKLRRGIQFGTLDPGALRQPITLTNPLDHDLTVSIRPTGEGAGAGVELVLAPGATQQGHLDLAWLREELDAAPWRGDVTVPLQILCTGKDQALSVRAPFEETLLVRPKHYPVSTGPAPTLDGHLSDWSPAPTVVMGPESRTVAGAASYRGAEDGLASVRLQRSDSHLFVAAEVVDDQVAPDGDGAILNTDAMHFLFASASDARTRQKKGQVIMHSVTSTGRVQSMGRDASTWTASVQRTDSGYTIEASVLLDELPVDKNGHIGFDLMLSDRDGEAKPTRLRLWSQESKASNPSSFGFLFL